MFQLSTRKISTAAADIISILLHVLMIPTANFQYKGIKTETYNRIETFNVTEHQMQL
jgi:hypothetical protein